MHACNSSTRKVEPGRSWTLYYTSSKPAWATWREPVSETKEAKWWSHISLPWKSHTKSMLKLFIRLVYTSSLWAALHFRADFQGPWSLICEFHVFFQCQHQDFATTQLRLTTPGGQCGHRCLCRALWRHERNKHVFSDSTSHSVGLISIQTQSLTTWQEGPLENQNTSTFFLFFFFSNLLLNWPNIYLKKKKNSNSCCYFLSTI